MTKLRNLWPVLVIGIVCLVAAAGVGRVSLTQVVTNQSYAFLHNADGDGMGSSSGNYGPVSFSDYVDSTDVTVKTIAGVQLIELGAGEFSLKAALRGVGGEGFRSVTYQWYVSTNLTTPSFNVVEHSSRGGTSSGNSTAPSGFQSLACGYVVGPALVILQGFYTNVSGSNYTRLSTDFTAGIGQNGDCWAEVKRLPAGQSSGGSSNFAAEQFVGVTTPPAYVAIADVTDGSSFTDLSFGVDTMNLANGATPSSAVQLNSNGEVIFNESGLFEVYYNNHFSNLSQRASVQTRVRINGIEHKPGQARSRKQMDASPYNVGYKTLTATFLYQATMNDVLRIEAGLVNDTTEGNAAYPNPGMAGDWESGVLILKRLN